MKAQKVRAYLAAVLAANFTCDELRYIVSNGLLSGEVFVNGELSSNYLPQREYGQKLSRALQSRFPPTDSMDVIMEMIHNAGSVVTSVKSLGDIGKDGIFEKILDGLFNVVGEGTELLKDVGIMSSIDRKNYGRDGKLIQASDIGPGNEIVEMLPYLGTSISFMDDTVKFGRLVNRDGAAIDPFINIM